MPLLVTGSFYFHQLPFATSDRDKINVYRRAGTGCNHDMLSRKKAKLMDTGVLDNDLFSFSLDGNFDIGIADFEDERPLRRADPEGGHDILGELGDAHGFGYAKSTEKDHKEADDYCCPEFPWRNLPRTPLWLSLIRPEMPSLQRR